MTRPYNSPAARLNMYNISMAYDPQKHHRHSIRLKGYDYTRAGAYFVTICAQKRELLFDPPPVREMIQRW